MGWYDVEKAVKFGNTRAFLEQRIASGQLTSYTDETGRRMVWVSADATPAWALSLVAKVRQRVSDLKRAHDTRRLPRVLRPSSARLTRKQQARLKRATTRHNRRRRAA